MRYALIDTTNNVCHLLPLYVESDPSQEVLQAEFERFVEKVGKQGLMNLCVGTVYLARLEDRGLRLHYDRSQPGRWRVDTVAGPATSPASPVAAQPQDYRVQYEVDVTAESPEAAAAEAVEMMRDATACPPLVDVKPVSRLPADEQSSRLRPGWVRVDTELNQIVGQRHDAT